LFPLPDVLVDDGDDNYIPTVNEGRRITALATAMNDFEEVTKYLQNEQGVTLLDVRHTF
jgi:hypothetical protein